MLILNRQISKAELPSIEKKVFFEGWIKCVADIDKGLLAVNASRNIEAGFPRDGRGVSDPEARKK